MSWGLDPGLTIYLHRCGLEECDTEVGSLGDANARAQPALYLALGGGGGASLAGHGAAQQPAHGPVLTMCITPVTPTTSSSPSSMRGFSNLESLSEPQRSAPEPQLPERQRGVPELGPGPSPAYACKALLRQHLHTWGC